MLPSRLPSGSTKARRSRPGDADIIIIDEVSRALGDPDLSDYVREFHHGHLQAWVRREKSQSSSTGG